MGFRRKNGKSGKKGSKKKSDAQWLQLGSMYENDKGNHNASIKPWAKDYDDIEIFIKVENDDTRKFYALKNISIFEPGDNAPDNCLGDLVVNLAGDYHVEEIDQDDE